MQWLFLSYWIALYVTQTGSVLRKWLKREGYWRSNDVVFIDYNEQHMKTSQKEEAMPECFYRGLWADLLPQMPSSTWNSPEVK